jgi:Ser/Thr protein kinase RdoA (MazF antagonist)
MRRQNNRLAVIQRSNVEIAAKKAQHQPSKRRRLTMTMMIAEAVPPAISHSVLNAKYLAYEVARRYPLKGPVKAQLMYRGMNDVYIVSNGDTLYALRVWRANEARAIIDDVAFEVDYLDYLKSRGFPASGAVRASDGSRFFCFDSPEGVRPIALYDWAPGAKFGEALDIGTAEKIGALFAKMHLLGLEYPGTCPERPAKADFVFGRPDDIRDYAILAHKLDERLKELEGQDLPSGICHRDFHPSNVHVGPNGVITFLDFDGCCIDYFMQDVQNYVWGNDFYAYPGFYGAAFERGYQTVRPFTADETANTELFLLCKAYTLISGLSVASNSVGRTTLRFRNLEWFSQTIKARARALGLL